MAALPHLDRLDVHLVPAVIEQIDVDSPFFPRGTCHEAWAATLKSEATTAARPLQGFPKKRARPPPARQQPACSAGSDGGNAPSHVAPCGNEQPRDITGLHLLALGLRRQRQEEEEKGSRNRKKKNVPGTEKRFTLKAHLTRQMRPATWRTVAPGRTHLMRRQWKAAALGRRLWFVGAGVEFACQPLGQLNGIEAALVVLRDGVLPEQRSQGPLQSYLVA